MENNLLDNDISAKEGQVIPQWAGFWIRTGASFIDLIAFLPLAGLNFYNLLVLKSLPLQLTINLLYLVYKPFMEYKYGATLGKMAVGIQVVNEKFESITLSQAIIRYIPWLLTNGISIISAILLFQNSGFAEASGIFEISELQNEGVTAGISSTTSLLMFASVITVAFNDRKQGLHDLIAKTYCIYK